jgi:solute carrier family 10 (sodium/bile acid cotransporter), member 7
VKDIYEGNSKKFKRLQELILLGIVWNAFCNAFSKGMGLEFRHAAALLAILPTLHIISLVFLFKMFQQPFWGLSRGETVAAMFCASHKTLAFGLPLVNTIFEGNPNLASYCAPIMFIHPLQLVLGSLLVPRLVRYTTGECEAKLA